MSALASFTKTIVTKRDGTCTYCGARTLSGVDFAGVDTTGRWHAICRNCSESYAHQAQGLVARIEAAAEGLDDEVLAPIAAAVAAIDGETAEAIAGNRAAGMSVVPQLQRILADVEHAGTPVSPLAAEVAALRANLGKLNAKDQSFALSLCDAFDRYGHLSDRQAPWVSTLLARTAPGAEAAAKADPPVGLHRNADGRIVKVYITQNGRKAGKVLTGHSFSYAPGAVRGLSEDTLLTEAEARAYGRSHGVCCNCGLALGEGDNAMSSTLSSLYAGYGPNCAQRHGWSFPSVREAVLGLRAEGISHPLLSLFDDDGRLIDTAA
jgi:transcription elongation factor Elf1